MVAACRGPLSTLDPVGPAAAAIAEIWWVMLAGAGLILAAVMGLVLVAFTRFRGLIGFSAQGWLIGGGLVFPCVVLTALLVYALSAGQALISGRSEDIQRIDAVARQWQWTFRYPAAGQAASTDLLHLPAGRHVDLHVTSEDVIHSFWIPRLGGKIDAIPGRVTVIRLLAPVPGEYLAQCAEFCGPGHSTMTFVAQASPPEQYETVLSVLASRSGER